jgi:hypothetical protein
MIPKFLAESIARREVLSIIPAMVPGTYSLSTRRDMYDHE